VLSQINGPLGTRSSMNDLLEQEVVYTKVVRLICIGATCTNRACLVALFLLSMTLLLTKNH
jgi:hypothetical protein